MSRKGTATQDQSRTVTVTLHAWQWDRVCAVLRAMADDINDGARRLPPEVKLPLNEQATQLLYLAKEIAQVVDNA